MASPLRRDVRMPRDGMLQCVTPEEPYQYDREENRALWRQTQRHIEEVAGTVRALAEQVNRVSVDLDRVVLESAARDRESHARDQALGERIDKLVSAMGEFIAGRRQ
jgi:hypothetical protein